MGCLSYGPRPVVARSRPRASFARQIAKSAPKSRRPVDRRRLLHVCRRSCGLLLLPRQDPAAGDPLPSASRLRLHLRQALGAGVPQGCHQQQHLKMTSSSSDGKCHASSLCSPLSCFTVCSCFFSVLSPPLLYCLPAHARIWTMGQEYRVMDSSQIISHIKSKIDRHCCLHACLTLSNICYISYQSWDT